jgi:hypothetical protein
MTHNVLYDAAFLQETACNITPFVLHQRAVSTGSNIETVPSLDGEIVVWKQRGWLSLIVT